MTRPTPMHSQSRRSAKSSSRTATPDADYDVLIIGGGLSGGTLAALLGEKGFRVGCIDRDRPVTQLDEHFDGRTTAVSWGSRNILLAAGVWELAQKDACPIRRIDILDGGSPVLLRFGAEEVENQSFGWILENRILRKALFDRMAALPDVTHFAPAQIESMVRSDDSIHVRLTGGETLSAAIVVGADGRDSMVRDWAGIGTRSWSYRQRAIVCTVLHEHPHHFVAVEHFRAQGPFAILPMTDGPKGEYRSSIVWTEDGPMNQSALHYGQDVFDAALTARFPDTYGSVSQTGRRFSYPLSLQHAYAYSAPRVALVADAAHGIHPIAGQGLNLGFRDIDALAQVLCRARDEGDDLGSDKVLAHYERRRRIDNMAMAGATDVLNRLFSTGLPGLPLLRQGGLRLVSRMKPVKTFFMHQAMGRKVR